MGAGLSSSVIPLVADQLGLARPARATYALMVSLLPATATVVGATVLAQLPSTRELAGVALVVLGVAVHRDPSTGQEPVERCPGPSARIRGCGSTGS